MSEDLEDGTRHYIIRCRLGGIDRFLLWYSDNVDGVVLDGTGTIVNLPTAAAAYSYAALTGRLVDDAAPNEFDVDRLERSLSEDPIQVDAVTYLDLWNLFCDVAASVQSDGAFTRADQAAGNVHEKLFFANNLPSVTPPGEHYLPKWSPKELSRIRQVLGQGIDLMAEALGDEFTPES